MKKYMFYIVLTPALYGAAHNKNPKVAHYTEPGAPTVVTIKDAYTDDCRHYFESTSLCLQGKRIQSLENAQDIPNADKVTTLTLSRNRLEHVRLQNLQSFVCLRNLDLSHNRIECIDLAPLAGLSKLRTLNLRKNYLEEIDLAPLERCSKLMKVDLSNNDLSTCNLSMLPAQCIVVLTGNIPKIVEHLQDTSPGHSVVYISPEIWNKAKQQARNMTKLNALLTDTDDKISEEMVAEAIELIKNTEQFGCGTAGKWKTSTIAPLIEQGEHGTTGFLLLMKLVSVQCIEQIAQAYCQSMPISDEELQKAKDYFKDCREETIGQPYPKKWGIWEKMLAIARAARVD